MDQFINIINLSLSREYCDNLIEFCENIYNENNEIITLKMYDNNNWKKYIKEIKSEIKKNVINYIKEIDINNIFLSEKNISNLNFELPILKKYRKDIGKLCYKKKNIYDIGKKKISFLTFIWFLNDNEDKDGGEIEFFGYYKIKPEKGKLIIFPSEIFFPYSIKLSSKDNYILTTELYIDL